MAIPIKADEMRAIIRDLDQDIRSSWMRCLDEYRLVPTRISKPVVITNSELQDQTEPIDELLALAAPEIKRLFARLLDSHYMVTVASKEGVNILSRCDYQLIGKMDSLGLLAGANWSEERQGTNGVGTCIRLEKPLSVVRTDHFSTLLKEISCSVVPVFGPRHELQCVINTSTDRLTDRAGERILRSIVEQSAHRIENAFFSRHYHNSRIVKLAAEPDFSDPANEVRLALNDAGQIVDATSLLSAKLRIDRERVIGRSVSEVLGSDFRKCVPRVATYLQSEYPEQSSVYALLEESSGSPRRRPPSGQAHSKVEPGGEMDALRNSVFRFHPPLVESFLRTCRAVRAGLPVVLRGEAGSGREAFARILQQASQVDFHKVRCGLDAPDAIARTLTDPGLSGIVYLEDAELASTQLVQAVSRIMADRDGSQAPAVCFIAGCSEGAERHGSIEAAFLVSASTLDLPAVRHYPNRAALVDWVLQEELQKSGLPDVRFDVAVMDVLHNNIWPGNLHQLRLVIRHVLAMRDEDETVLFHHLPESLRHGDAFPDDPADAERGGLIAALNLNRWNVSKTADYLGTSRATLNRRIRTLGLARPS